MRRSTRSLAPVNRRPVPSASRDPALRNILRSNSRYLYTSIVPERGKERLLRRRTRTVGERSPSSTETVNRQAPVPPTWSDFAGGGGAFRGQLKFPQDERSPHLSQFIVWEVELASDSAFTTDRSRYRLGPSFGIYFPEVTRFARARARYVNSPFSAWRVYTESSVATSKASGTAGAGVPEPSPPPDPPPPGGGGGGGGYQYK